MRADVRQYAKMKHMKFPVSIYQDEDGAYIAECPSIPGCVSQGQTEAEAESNIADAIREVLAVRAELGSLAPGTNHRRPDHWRYTSS
jgi:predicted RNase H-like HicB family nuclease